MFVVIVPDFDALELASRLSNDVYDRLDLKSSSNPVASFRCESFPLLVPRREKLYVFRASRCDRSLHVFHTQPSMEDPGFVD